MSLGQSTTDGSALNNDWVVLGITLLAVFSLVMAGPGAAAAQDMADSDASWYVAEASLVWGIANEDPVGAGLGAAGMVLVVAGVATGGVGSAAVLM